ncbi:TetR/AcrR family transcriptional regulator [Catellatospora vulcania]|uniref:TetR/AcrR family transcriptional regulator n=1 Tax=Catellatospora vulcania TaxID=1460450 RepID=UPI0018AF6A02|nr:TetR/AcrR family transcriptional regulator [Catellatospora vulcania]
MATGSPRTSTTGENPSGQRRRDAAGTRQLLLDAARRRFAAHGYTGTTVRDIADEAGVNVALISRYFASKEGLFEACLAGAVDELSHAVTENVTLDRLPQIMAEQLAGTGLGSRPNQFLLLLRSSGDERADQIRRNTVRSFAERLASAAGWRPDHPDGDRLMLRAQIALATAFGIVLLRSSTGLEPLSSATPHDLVAPLRDVVDGLLRERGTR